MIAQINTSSRYPALMRTEPALHRVQPGAVQADQKSPDLLQIEGVVQVVTANHRSFFTQVLAQALRSAGQGTPVLVVQFLKGGIRQGKDHPVTLGHTLDWYRCDVETGMDPYRPDTISLQAKEAIQDLWSHTCHLILSDRYELAILDELSIALNLGLIQETEALSLFQNRPAQMDLILTGAQMPKTLLQLADQVTELRKPHRH